LISFSPAIRRRSERAALAEVLRASSEPTLTVVTCYPFDYPGSAPQRFIVSARLVQAEPRV